MNVLAVVSMKSAASHFNNELQLLCTKMAENLNAENYGIKNLHIANIK